MFEESAWDVDGASEPGSASPPQPPFPGRGGSSRTHRRRQLPGTRCPSEGPSPPPASASDQQPRRKGERRAPRRPVSAAGPEQPPPPQKKKKAQGTGERAAAGGDPALHSKQSCSQIKQGRTEEVQGQLLTRRQWRNRQKNKRRQKNKFKTEEGPATRDLPVPPPTEEPPGSQEGPALSASMAEESPGRRAAVLRLRMEERLDSAHFRYINQQLYTCPSQEAARLFQEDPEALAIYHRGFARQVARWPERPVQRMVQYLRHRPASLVVADFGCGDCTLARSLRNKVHCFDLVALDPRVIVCDMAQVPLEAESVDVAVFCLALMGTNLCEILEEANRVLRAGGALLVAEVASRFADVRGFVGSLAQLGFRLVAKDVSGSHFYTFEFRKTGPARGGQKRRRPPLALRPCLYKRR